MLRFIATRILAAIPVLLILSVVTFGIIKAQPGDYADYLKSMLMTPGQRLQRRRPGAGRRLSRGARAERPAADAISATGSRGIVTRFDFGDSFYYNKPVGTVVQERLSRTHPAGADLPPAGVADRHNAGDCRGDPAI